MFTDRSILLNEQLFKNDAGSLGRMNIRLNCHQDELIFSSYLETDVLLSSSSTIIVKNYFNNNTRKNSLCYKEGKVHTNGKWSLAKEALS